MNDRTHEAAAATVPVVFSFACQGARTVCVVVFFNDWSPQLKRALGVPPSENGLRPAPSVRTLVRLSEVTPAVWSGAVAVRPGWCEYLFLVDGEWVLDPNASERYARGAGEFSSVRWIARQRHSASIRETSA